MIKSLYSDAMRRDIDRLFIIACYGMTVGTFRVITGWFFYFLASVNLLEGWIIIKINNGFLFDSQIHYCPVKRFT